MIPDPCTLTKGAPAALTPAPNPATSLPEIAIPAPARPGLKRSVDPREGSGSPGVRPEGPAAFGEGQGAVSPLRGRWEYILPWEKSFLWRLHGESRPDALSK